jgi:hypothetical protein
MREVLREGLLTALREEFPGYDFSWVGDVLYIDGVATYNYALADEISLTDKERGIVQNELNSHLRWIVRQRLPKRSRWYRIQAEFLRTMHSPFFWRGFARGTRFWYMVGAIIFALDGLLVAAVACAICMAIVDGMEEQFDAACAAIEPE